MSWDEEFPEWFRRRHRLPFSGDSFFEEINRMMEDMFKDFTRTQPGELVREKRLPDGSIVREAGPFVYGYSMTMGPDGKPMIREFGNLKPSMKPTPLGFSKPSLEPKQEREPLVDTVIEDKNVKIVAELPGVERSDINLEATEKSLTITVDTDQRKYYKQLDLPADVDPDSSKASFKNGVLEVVFTRAKPRKKGKEIKIE